MKIETFLVALWCCVVSSVAWAGVGRTEGKFEVSAVGSSDGRIAVAQITSSDGTGGNFNRSYWYTGGRVDEDRNTFNGFEKIEVTDARNSLVHQRVRTLVWRL